VNLSENVSKPETINLKQTHFQESSIKPLSLGHKE
jgi:hypothetical protein